MNSPVQLANYRVQKFHFDILDDGKEVGVEEAEIDLNVDYEIFDDNDDESTHRIDLFVELSPAKEGTPRFPFAIEIVLQGIFFLEDDIDLEEKAYHLNISCNSMLYGVVRNLVHQITGQTNYGSISIPSVQFSQLAKQKADEESEKEENTD